jgi:transglutaminase-like putative cysteine protease
MRAAIRGFIDQYLTKQFLRNMLLVYLIFIMLVNVLRDSIQGVENSLLMLMIAIGLILGWLLAISKLEVWKSVLITILSGGTILLIRVGRLGSLIWSLFGQVLDLGLQTWQWIWEKGEVPRSLTIPTGIAELGSRILILGSRLGVWIQSLLRGKPIFDPVATAFIWGIFIWIIAVWAIWITIKGKNPLPGIIPILVLTSISLVYTDSSVYNLIPMLGLTVGLVVMGRYDAQEDQWKSNDISFAGIIRERMFFFSLIMAVGLMIFAAISPSITIRSFVDFIDKITSDSTDDDLARSLGLEPPARGGNVDVLTNRQTGGLPNRHLIGSGEELDDQIVMIIQAQELTDTDQEGTNPEEHHYYWRGLTYDQYIGRGWAARDSVNIDYKPGENTLSSWPETYQIIRQKVEIIEDLNGLFYSAGIPLSADQDFEVAWRVQNTNQDTFDIFGATIDSNSYTADSLQPRASSDELQGTRQEYPIWIQNRYLGLPDSIPERVIALARDITATEPTPYDRAIAIETFLRRFPYTLDLPQPPLDRDITDYFLFSAQRGYCDYYATAMVVLSRAAGVPARLVTGYVGGHYDENLDAILVTANLAHTWVEIYFPDYGWIIFEPTGGIPEIDRPEDPIPVFSQDYASAFDPLVPEKPGLRVNWFIVMITILLGVPGIVFIGLWVDEQILKRLPEQKLLIKIYRRIYRYAHWIGHKSKPGDTPYEFNTKMIRFINQYGKGSKEADWLLTGSNQLREITQAYYLAIYSHDQDERVNSTDLMLSYRTLRNRLWYLWLLVHAYPYRILRFFLWDNPQMLIDIGPTH